MYEEAKTSKQQLQYRHEHQEKLHQLMTEYKKISKQAKDILEELHHKTHTCCICLEEMCKEEKTKAVPCGHEFHEPCINKWLETQKDCPICRQDCKTTVTCKGISINDAILEEEVQIKKMG